MNLEVSRSKLHELAVQLMYSFIMLKNEDVEINFEEAVSSACNLPYSECDVFLKEVLIKGLMHIDEISNYLDGFLRKWKFKRLNTTIQAVLIIGVSEYFYVDEKIDKAIIINNAVKLAKKFGDGGQQDYKYVNAVLENCLKDEGRKVLFN